MLLYGCYWITRVTCENYFKFENVLRIIVNSSFTITTSLLFVDHWWEFKVNFVLWNETRTIDNEMENARHIDPSSPEQKSIIYYYLIDLKIYIYPKHSVYSADFFLELTAKPYIKVKIWMF